MKQLYMLRVPGTDSWVRWSFDVSGRMYATLSPWGGPLGPPSMFTDMNMLKEIAAIVPKGTPLETVVFKPDGLPSALEALVPKMTRCSSTHEAWHLLGEVLTALGYCERCRGRTWIMVDRSREGGPDQDCVECPKCKGAGKSHG